MEVPQELSKLTTADENGRARLLASRRSQNHPAREDVRPPKTAISEEQSSHEVSNLTAADENGLFRVQPLGCSCFGHAKA